MGYGWFKYVECLGPRSEFWSIYDVQMMHSLGGVPADISIFRKLRWFVNPGGFPQKQLIWVPWWFLAISRKPSIGYGWFWYITGMRPKGKFWRIWNVSIYHSLGVETVASWISEIQDFSLSRGSYACYVRAKSKSELILWFLGHFWKNNHCIGQSRYEAQERSYEGI